MRVLIAGAGIGGLAAAAALGRLGAEVTVLEKAGELREIGAGLTIWPNGSAALRELGADLPDNRPLSALRIKNWRGRTLMTSDCSDFELRFGAPALPMPRSRLQQVLRPAAAPANIVVKTDIVNFHEGEGGVSATDSGGETWSGDVLIGADGLDSTVRRRLLGDGPPRYTGVTVWRGLAASSTGLTPPGESWTLLGRGSEFGFMPMVDGRIYWFASREAPAGELAGAAGHRADVAEIVDGWAAPVGAILDSTDEAAIVRTDIFDRPPGRTWTRGRVALLGDAAHPMTPHASQGACQALEDAVVLARAFAGAGGDIASALLQYQERRLKRANSMVRLSARSGAMIRVRNPIACALRDLGIALTPAPLARRAQYSQLRPV